jgi:5'(3')-deoxyribonucleotidase
VFILRELIYFVIRYYLKSIMVKTLAIDLDSVLADTMLLWADEYNRRKHANIRKNDIISWELPDVFNMPVEEISQIFTHIWDRRWKEIPPTEPDIANTTYVLHQRGYRISILTKRFRPSVVNVAKWLDLYEVYCDDLLFVYDDRPKGEYPFDILVDDAPINLMNIRRPRKGILYSQPWNTDFVWPDRISKLTQLNDLI